MLGMLVALVLGAVCIVVHASTRPAHGPDRQRLFMPVRDILEFFLIGMVLFGIGLLGEYVGRIYQQVRGRPRYLIQAVLERASTGANAWKRQAVVFAYHDVGVRCLRVLLERGVDVPLVVTHHDDPGENTSGSTASPSSRAEHGIDVVRRTIPTRPNCWSRLRPCSPTSSSPSTTAACCRPRCWRTARRGAFNMHGSLLPRYRGRAPVNWAVINGETETGATLHDMVEKPDAGRIVDQAARADRPRRHRASRCSQGHRGAAERCCARILPRLMAGTAPLQAAGLCRGQLLRRPQARGRAHRLAQPARGDPQPGARGGAALSRRLHRLNGEGPARTPDSHPERSAPPGRRSAGPLSQAGRRMVRAALRRWSKCLRLAARCRIHQDKSAMKKILILGVNGFIGHHLSKRILETTDWEVYGMDMQTDRVADLLDEHALPLLRRRHHHQQGMDRVPHPQVRHGAAAGGDRHAGDLCEGAAARLRTRLRGQPADRARLRASTASAWSFRRPPRSTACAGDGEFDPEASQLVYGPINKPRWIYACSKQLMDRVIWAYGDEAGLDFTLFRPFNWIGAGLDSINTAKEGSSRVVTQFLGHIVRGEPIKLVDGGRQKRAFTYIDDGIDALMRIIDNPAASPAARSTTSATRATTSRCASWPR